MSEPRTKLFKQKHRRDSKREVNEGLRKIRYGGELEKSSRRQGSANHQPEIKSDEDRRGYWIWQSLVSLKQKYNQKGEKCLTSRRKSIFSLLGLRNSWLN